MSLHKKELAILRTVISGKQIHPSCRVIWARNGAWTAVSADDSLTFYDDDLVDLGSAYAHDPKRLAAGLIGLSPDETAPDVPGFYDDVAADNALCVGASDLRRAVDHAALAADPDSFRFALGGVLLESDRVVGTDTRRMHFATIDTGETGNLDKDSVILPLKATNTLSKLLADSRGSVAISVNCQYIVILGENVRGRSWRLVSRRLEGRYPNVDDVIKYAPTETIVLADDDYRAEIATACKVIDREKRGVHFDSGRWDYRGVVGRFFAVYRDMLDCTFVRDALAGMNSATTVAKFGKVGAPVTITDGTLSAILMPMSEK